MNMLIDPGFVYPDLVVVAEGMVAGTISAQDASALARKVTGGELRNTSVGRALVIGPQGGAERALAGLQAYANEHDQRSAERWAAFALMVESQLGVENLDPAAAPMALGNAMRVFDACVRATGARCPSTGVKFALQAVDALLASRACTEPGLRARLSSARASFAASARE